MAVGLYGYLFCVLCISGFFNVASAECQYKKQDIAYKVVKSDLVLTGKVTGITDGDDKYFPGIQGAMTIDMNIECIYKGPSMNSAAKVYGVGELNSKLFIQISFFLKSTPVIFKVYHFFFKPSLSHFA